jgi:acid phosphatase family membrane protein YuiD
VRLRDPRQPLGKRLGIFSRSASAAAAFDVILFYDFSSGRNASSKFAQWLASLFFEALQFSNGIHD